MPRPSSAQTVPANLNISGGLFNSSGQPITSSNVRFKIDIYDKNATCLLYTEQHSGIDLSNTRGAFSLIIGSGTSQVNNLEGTTAFDAKIFENNGAVAPFTGCGSGLTFSPGDSRLIRVSYDLGGGLVAMTPDIPITSSAYAMVAETLQGKAASDFIMTNVNTSLSQANVDYIFSNTNYPNLKALVDGTSSQYIVSNPSAAVGFNGQRLINVGTPTSGTDATNKTYVDANLGGKGTDFSAVGPGMGGGRTIVWDQTQNKWVTSSTGSVGLVAAGTGLNGGNITASGTLSVDVGTTANKILQLDASARIPAVDASLLTNVNAMFLQGRSVSIAAPAAQQVLGWNVSTSQWEPETPTGGTVTGLTGDVSGSGTGVISTTIQPNAVTSAKINNTGVAVNRLLITDATTGATVGYASCALGEVMQWTATGWACKSVTLMLGTSGVTAGTYGNSTQVSQVGVDAQGRVVSLTNVNIAFPVTSVAGRTGAISLTASDVSGLGTAATQNVGTGANDVLQFSVAGQLPALDGSLLTNLPVSSQWITSGSNIYYNLGNVGIGTTNPKSLLHTAGGNVTHYGVDNTTDFAFQLGRTNATAEITIAPSTGADHFAMSALAGDGVIRTEGTTRRLLFDTSGGNATPAIAIAPNSAAVGIGKSSPSETLTVGGNELVGAAPSSMTTLSAAITNGVTTIPVVSTTGYPTTGTVRILGELMTYTGLTSTTFTGVTRGAFGTTATAASTGATVNNVLLNVAPTSTTKYFSVLGNGTLDAGSGNSTASGAPNAVGNPSFIVGNNNTTNSGAFIFGSNNSTGWSSNGATAIGGSVTVNGWMGTGIGHSLTVASMEQTNFGIWNQNLGGENTSSWVATDPLFVFANGNGSPSNAILTLKNASTIVNSGTLSTVSSPTLATVMNNSIFTTVGSTADSTTAALNAVNSAKSTLLYVRNDGNVGIGTSTPAGNLAVDNSGHNATICLNGSCVSSLASSGGLSTSGGTMTGQLVGEDGLVSAPGFAFAGDTGTGIYDVTPGTLGVSASGTQVMNATSSVVTVPLSTASTSASTGALVVSGGVGVAGNLNAGGNINAASGQSFEIGGANALSYPASDTTPGGSVAIGINSLANQPASAAYGNTAVGYQAIKGGSGTMTTAAIYNTAVGNQVLTAITTGAANTAVGWNALLRDTTGSYNVAIGKQALVNNTTGQWNTAIGGDQTMLLNTTGSYNTGLNNYALYTNSSGISNTALGIESLYSANANYNVAVGNNSLNYETSGGSNVAIGYKAGFGVNATTTANDSVFVGYQAGDQITTGNGNTALGYQSGYDLTTGADNIILGYYPTTAVGVTTGSNNILIGEDVRPPSQTASNQLNIGNLIYATGLSTGATLSTGNVGIGTASPGAALDVNGAIDLNGLNAIRFPASDSTVGASIAIGASALASQDSLASGGFNNTALGYQAISSASLTTGATGLVAVGTQALKANTSGANNVAVGATALYSNTAGSWNTALGTNTLKFGNSYYNTAVGDDAGLSVGTNGYNTYVGANAGGNNNGGSNTAVGYKALQGTSGAGGTNNVALGYQAASDLTGGSQNISIGYFPTTGVGITTGNNNILIGYDVRPTAQTVSNSLNVGNLIYATGLGSGPTGASGNVGIGTPTPQAVLDVASTGSGQSAIIVPRDTQANRPAGVNGMIRYNTSTGAFEGFAGGSWGALSGGGGSASSVSAANGSAVAPSISFSSDSGTGFYDAGSHTVGVAANGTAVETISGTATTILPTTVSTSPSTGALVVDGGVGIAGDVNTSGNLTVGNTIQSSGLTASHYSNANYTSTSAASDSPLGTTIIISNSYNSDSSGSFDILQSRNTAGTYQSAYVGAVSNTGAGVYSPAIVIGQQTGATAYAERMRIDQNGNVGIGTVSPGNTLEVNGNANFGMSPSALATLAAGISNVDTTMTVGSTAGYPASGILKVDSEFIGYTGTTSTSFTGLTRGVYSSTAVAHSSAANVLPVLFSAAGSKTNDGPGLLVSGTWNSGTSETLSWGRGRFTAGGDFGISNSVYSAFNLLTGNSNGLGGSASGAIIGGLSSSAQGTASFTIGNNLNSSSYAAVTFGQFNKDLSGMTNNSWVSTEPLLVVGNGSSAAATSNSLMIYKNGQMLVDGGTTTAIPAGNASMTVMGTTTDNTASSFNATDSAGASKLYVRNDGNVGIGTTSPTSLLSISGPNGAGKNFFDINGAMIVDQWGQLGLGTGGPLNAYLDVENNHGAGELSAIFNSVNSQGNGVTIETVSNSSSYYSLNILGNGGARSDLYVRADGYVGVGTLTPQTTLDVNGPVTFEQSYFENVGAVGSLACGSTDITGFTTNIYTLTACASGTTTYNIPTITGWPNGNKQWTATFYVTGQTASVFNITYNASTANVYWDMNSTGGSGGNNYTGFTVPPGHTDVITCSVINAGTVNVYCRVAVQY